MHALVFAVGIVFGILLMAVVPFLGDWLGVTMPMWVDVILLFAISGAFGGMLGAIQTTDITRLIKSSLQEHWNRARFCNVFLALVVSGLGGMGGATAAMLVIALDKKIEPPLKDVDRLIFVGLGVVAGFLGFKLLGSIAERVGNWLKLKQEIEQTKHEFSENLAKERRRSEELTAVILQARDVQEDDTADASAIARTIKELERVRADYPEHRTVAVMLAWFYANKVSDLQKAIKVLNETLQAIAALNLPPDKNVGDIHYNLACYEYRLAQQATDPAEKTKLIDSMYRDLREAVRLNPENAREAREETSDFEAVKNEEQFKQITGQTT